jgi:hypothetical protein
MPIRTILGATALISTVLMATQAAPAAPADRYLHVQVSESNKQGENVNVNVPLAVAEKVLPTIDRGPLHQGRVTISSESFQGIDLPTIMEAIRSGPDGQIVSVKEKDENVDVSKANGNIVVHVRDKGPQGEKVDVTVPVQVVNALFSGTQKGELDVAAALQALDQAGDTFLVTVEDASEHVRVWVDSHSQPQ